MPKTANFVRVLCRSPKTKKGSSGWALQFFFNRSPYKLKQKACHAKNQICNWQGIEMLLFHKLQLAGNKNTIILGIENAIAPYIFYLFENAGKNFALFCGYREH